MNLNLFILIGSQLEEKKVPFNANELILDGGFVVPKTLSSDDEIFEVPDINSFGQSFRYFNYFIYLYIYHIFIRDFDLSFEIKIQKD